MTIIRSWDDAGSSLPSQPYVENKMAKILRFIFVELVGSIKRLFFYFLV